MSFYSIHRYAHENDCPWNGSALIGAVFGGHLDCVKYLFENECEVDENICTTAATSGFLNCLQYATFQCFLLLPFSPNPAPLLHCHFYPFTPLRLLSLVVSFFSHLPIIISS
jgi:hypothetical protein